MDSIRLHWAVVSGDKDALPTWMASGRITTASAEIADLVSVLSFAGARVATDVPEIATAPAVTASDAAKIATMPMRRALLMILPNCSYFLT
jgi:hypothetical protein